ncbi:MAG: hypothetical protein HRF49_01320 [bacterium]|jgi:aromatic ring-opening dioxygenase LigB subunit
MLVTGGIVPHPPVLVPEIGCDRLAEVAATSEALSRLAARVGDASPDVVIMSGPHHPRARHGRAGVVSAAKLRGDFADFGCPDVSRSVDGSPELAAAVLAAVLPLETHEIKSGELDWGYLVFLDAAARLGYRPVVLPISLAWAPLIACFQFGAALAEALQKAFPAKRLSWVASGDLSHCTRKGMGREYDPWGKKFDEIVVAAVRDWHPDAILSISGPELVKAMQCGAPSFAAGMGFYSRAEAAPCVLSYEDPFGVGYLVAQIEVKGGSPN